MIFNAGVSFDKLVGTQSGRFIVKTIQDYNRVSALCAASIVVSLALKTEASPYVWEVAEGATVTENSLVTDATLGTSDGIRKTGEGNLRLANTDLAALHDPVYLPLWRLEMGSYNFQTLTR